jgi:chorismate synthase
VSSIIGDKLKISIFGQSHSPAIGVTIDGFPSGFEIDDIKLADFLKRRAPGLNNLSTARKEADKPNFISGLVNNTTCGAPITAIIENTDCRSKDYNSISDTYRPAHADFTADVKFKGFQDKAGGGHFSGRLTAPLCVAGAIALQYLEKTGIKISAKAIKIGKADTDEGMVAEIENARKNGDSVGGIIECIAEGVPAGIGDPIFDGIENKISQYIFGIPAIKGIEFGSGFFGASLLGSENNDEFTYIDGQIKTKTNNHGGILGGITSGMPIVFRVAVKPTPSIAKSQQSISIKDKCEKEIKIEGRHDPCIVLRALPCVESACALALLDKML